ncbi:sensor histidine kinase [Bacillus sp. mrc49]|uniref:sensor histidine kinase n=1 Tax=Bacillus sp. mrc49 TaxID=2054913 RepID=UPI000C27FA0E|nr:HAMP domain-containing sensor histidine kinase [Bacillus sp. mrc49]PJN91621.1 two-component sensor histidine kinase [Bacillus sp. mrc49]
MRNIKLNDKLIIKLYVVIAISFLVAIGMMMLISYFTLPVFMKDPTEINLKKYNLMLISLGILTFIVSSLFLVRKKLVYLKLITENIEQIANGKLGLTIEVQGRDEMAQLAMNINSMSEELKRKFENERRLESSKNELITNVSHDLRTPLTSIIGYLDLLRKGQYENREQLQEYVETIYGKSQRLKNLINELFEYTRLSSPDVRLNLRTVDLASLIRQMFGEYIPLLEDERLTIRESITEEVLPVLIDVEKMVRVYENLIMNAIKYSMKPSPFQIVLKSEGVNAVLEVSNKIVAAPIDDANKLFDRLFIDDEERTGNGGTGLGLAISKRIVHLHEGAIRAEYNQNWISFIVELPIQK